MGKHLKAWGVAVAVACLFAMAAPRAQAEATDPLASRMNDFTSWVSPNPSNFEGAFSAEFLRAVPPAKIAAILRDLYAEGGPITSVRLVNQPSAERASYKVTYKRGLEGKIDLVVDSRPPHAITGLWIGPSTPAVSDMPALVDRLRKLPGSISFSATRFDRFGARNVAELNPDLPLALGSGFKLFVLGALVEEISAGQRRWGDILTVKDEWKSLPSGIMQDWPAGTPASIDRLASLMISKSDNTATDHLLLTLGRQRVERMLAPMGVNRPEFDCPMLTTREMFLLKGYQGGSNLSEWLRKDPNARRRYLDEVVAKQSLQDVTGFGSHGPVAVDTVEWFASSHDMIRALDWIRQHTEQGEARRAREILAINPGLSFDKGSWAYVGYKGGSEPGVLNMNFLLQSTGGDWYAMSACWSNPKAEVDTRQLAGLLEKAADLLIVR